MGTGAVAPSHAAAPVPAVAVLSHHHQPLRQCRSRRPLARPALTRAVTACVDQEIVKRPASSLTCQYD